MIAAVATQIAHDWKFFETEEYEILGLCFGSTIVNSKTSTDLGLKDKVFTVGNKKKNLKSYEFLLFHSTFLNFLYFV